MTLKWSQIFISRSHCNREESTINLAAICTEETGILKGESKGREGGAGARRSRGVRTHPGPRSVGSALKAVLCSLTGVPWDPELEAFPEVEQTDTLNG